MFINKELPNNPAETLNQNDENSCKKKSPPAILHRSIDNIEDTLKDPKLKKKEKFKITKNLWLISLGFLFNFIAFNGTSSLQSSLNYSQGLGTVSLSVIYGSLVLSCLFTPTIFIKKLGCKWTICLSIMGYITYPLANFYPHWGTLILSSLIVGFSAAPLWTAKSTYLTTTAERYAKLNDETIDAVLNRFLGIFFLMFQLNYVIGQLISSFVLSNSSLTNLVLPDCYNASYIKNYCGSRDCQEDYVTARISYNSSACPVTQLQSKGVESVLLYILMGVYAGVGSLGAIIVGIFVDPISAKAKETESFSNLITATFRHMANRRQLLLIFITAFSGFEQAFIIGDYTRSFISCSLAVNWIGFILICFGTCNSIGSLLLGRIEKYTGRIPLFTMAFLMFLTLIIVFLIWIPYPTNTVLYFLLPGVWGVADAAWKTQLNAFYGVLFLYSQEAAFANYRLWESLGFTVAFALQSSLCLNVKLWLLLSVLLLGMFFYYILEHLVRNTKATHSKIVKNIPVQIAEENVSHNESTKV